MIRAAAVDKGRVIEAQQFLSRSVYDKIKNALFQSEKIRQNFFQQKIIWKEISKQ